VTIFKLADFEALARESLSPEAYAYYAGGAGDEITLKENIEAFRRYRLRPRVLIDVERVDASTKILGTSVAMPVGLAPTALNGLAHPEGEVATARAAARANVLMCLSTMSSHSLEDVAAVAKGPMWFQLYVHKDRGISKWMLERAAAGGYGAIVLTADLPYPGNRERELRHPIESVGPEELGNFTGIAEVHAGDFMELLEGVINASVTWGDLEWIQSVSGLPLIVKGLVTGEDASRAVEQGAAGVVVSNHGGRQLDRSIATIDALEEVVQAVAGRAEVYVDGGVRRGVDVVTALALGAHAVFIGRPYLFALAADGEDGVVRALELLRWEIENAMGLLGATTVAGIERSHVA
jgi:isopentenyl diphosphate isomerase/L-lactate dehydrogenase-like FMN-dependent dehydrogenase